MSPPRRSLADAPRALAVGAAGAALIVVALAFDTAPLLVPGFAFVALALVLPLSVKLAAAGASVERVMGETETVEGARYRGAVTVGVGPLGLVGAAVSDPVAGDPVPVRIGPSWRRRRSLRFDVVTAFARRGRVELPPPVLTVSDPLGLRTRTLRGRDRHELTVLPAVEPVTWIGREGRGRSRTVLDSARADALAAAEIDGLRPYRAGTPASRIHWPALARGAGLLERRMRAEEDPRPLVVLDTRVPDGDVAALDAPVRAAASLVLSLARDGGCGLLVGGDSRVLEVDERLAGWRAARRRLALTEPGAEPPAIGATRRLTAVHYVTASESRVPPAVRESGGVLVRPARDGAESTGPGAGPGGTRGVAVLTVAGCVGVAFAPRRGAPRGRSARVATGARVDRNGPG